MFEQGGDDALDPIPNAGGKSRLSDTDRAKLAALLQLGARTSEFPTELWTLRRVRDVIEREFDVRYSISNVHVALHSLGFSPQKAVRRAREQNTEAVERFRDVKWPHIKKSEQEGRVLALSDESGFMLQPSSPRTWAPRGETPELICGARYDRVSAISAITISPHAHRTGLYFRLLRGNFNADEIERFVRQVQRAVRRPVTFVWDRLSAHRTVAKRLEGDARFEFILLPAYAPTLNPDEWVWRYAKHHLLANSCPMNGDALERGVRAALGGIAKRQDLLHGFIRGARLPL
ncbi:Mobile element protein (plasmid) [Sandaracinus amylolyticus]|nr:IS630 family transposase [Sandaracinus sp.]QRN75775.1 transposase [Sandaracinus sp.]UJR87287.1 Mobile element protein [Sandaracinus amylolyticus]